MADANEPWAQPDAEALREWMFSFLLEHTGDDCTYHNMLERSAFRWNEFEPLNATEIDRAEIFKELITSLADFLGSEGAVGKWLVHSKAFKEFGGAPPKHYLEAGGFWTLSLLNDVIRIAKAFPTDPLGLRSEVQADNRKC